MARKPAQQVPRKIAFLLLDGFALMSYSSAIEPLRAANLLSSSKLYQLEHLVGRGTHALSSSGARIEATATLDGISRLDYVFVVGGGDPLSFKGANVMRWLRKMARHGVVLGGISGGPVILALAGLLPDRRMTVHWEHAVALLEALPHLLIERSLYVMDRDRITCAGGIAPLDLMHALIAEHHGATFARKVSDWFLHTDVRPSGGPQRAGLAERYATTNLPVLVAIEAMENHMADPLGLPQLAAISNTGTRQLSRLFKAELGLSPMAFYRNLRLEKALGLLNQSPLTLTEIALATGFCSSAHFSTAFRARFGNAPSRLRGDG